MYLIRLLPTHELHFILYINISLSGNLEFTNKKCIFAIKEKTMDKKIDYNNIDIEQLIKDYHECGSLHRLASMYHTDHLKLSKILKEHIQLKNHGNRKDIPQDIINKIIHIYTTTETPLWKLAEQYGIYDKKLKRIMKMHGVEIGKWRHHEKKEETPIVKKEKKVDNCEYKICPICGWKTKDVKNKGYSFPKHIFHTHNISIQDYLKEHQEDKDFFKNYTPRKEKIQCKICGKYLHLIDDRHLQKHNLTKEEYLKIFPNENLTSLKTKEKLRECHQRMVDNPDWERFSSTYEVKIQNFLRENHIDFITHNKSILKGFELDIVIPSHGIAIEFNGNRWHTEWFGGKTRMYHLNKTKACNDIGLKLIHIFEDEMVFKEDIVFHKLEHVLHINLPSDKVMGRKCQIREIDHQLGNDFLEIHHIQGSVNSSVYLGAFYNEQLIGVMSFKRENRIANTWDLTRLATDNNIICQGVAGKLFSYFIKQFKPTQIKSFADRRWTLSENDNIYIKLGFMLNDKLLPDYKYYNANVNHFKRYHKFNFRKNILTEKYHLDPSLTETEMVKQLGYDRIWDCGLFKYVWTNKKEED